jgi:M6 family metalloprotease-like protein
MDYYDTNYDEQGQFEGTGNWDVMAGGSWNADGAIPADFNPYGRISLTFCAGGYG